ncbi:MAG: CopD family protein [Chloroflexota bacterium]|nr:MAG: CopD family protein [Chloroflexota bacterium]
MLGGVHHPQSAVRKPKSAIRLLAAASLLFVTWLALPLSAEAHGGGPESIVSFSGLVNWLHLVGTVAWLGGIIFLRLFLGPALRILHPAERAQLMSAVLQRYVHLAWWSIATLVFTGMLTTWTHVPTPETFTGTTYGLILTAKILLSVGMVLCTLVITVATKKSTSPSSGNGQANFWLRWSHLATRVNLAFAVLMLLFVAGLTEFERTPLNVFINLVYYSGITIWLGGLAFIPVILGPSLRSLEESSQARLAGTVLARFQRLVWTAALVTITTSAFSVVRGIDSLADLWTEGFGIASTLHLFSLVAVLIVMLAARITPHDLLRRRGGDALVTYTPSLLIAALALLFFAFGGALDAPNSATLAAEIPLAIQSGAGPALNLMEPLGYVIAIFVAAAIIWHFAVVEERAEKGRESTKSV